MEVDHVAGKKRPLRVGLLVDSFVQPRWVYRAIGEIASSGIADLVLVVKNEAAERERGSRLQSLLRNRSKLLYALYERLDRRRFRTEPDPFESVDMESLVRGCAVLGIRPSMTKHCDYFDQADLDAIGRYDLDVAIRFGFRILKGRALDIARYGVWSYHHGDNEVYRGGPPGFWEVMEGHPVTGSMLQILTEDLDAGRVIYRSYARTDPLSVTSNRTNYYWKSSAFLLRKLRDLYEDGPGALTEGSPSERGWSAYSRRLYTTPDNPEMVGLLLRLGGRYLRSKLTDRFTFDQWLLAYRIGKAPLDGDGPDRTPYRFQRLTPPRDRYWADPFATKKGDRYFVFFEEFLYGANRAHISVLEIGADGRRTQPVKVLERDYHLSYPFVFEWERDHFMIPETKANRTVEVYRAVSFPDRWELERVLLSDLAAADATLAEVEGRWWMFVNIAVEGASTWDELHLFHSDGPLGPWRPHRRNPVKSDVRSARPAGRIFRWNGELYRPAQDCSAGYGHAITINRIHRLDRDEYREVEVSKISPHWLPDLTGTHTINAAEGLTVLDARIRRWKFRTPR